MARHRRQTEKVTVRLYEGDKERLNAYFPTQRYTKIIRELVHRTLRQLDEKLEVDNLPAPEVDLDGESD